MSTTATRLYPPNRLVGMPVGQMATIFAFAVADARNDTTVYSGMNREQTHATAWRTCSDIAVELTARAADGDPDAPAVIDRLAKLL